MRGIFQDMSGHDPEDPGLSIMLEVYESLGWSRKTIHHRVD